MGRAVGDYGRVVQAVAGGVVERDRGGAERVNAGLASSAAGPNPEPLLVELVLAVDGPILNARGTGGVDGDGGVAIVEHDVRGVAMPGGGKAEQASRRGGGAHYNRPTSGKGFRTTMDMTRIHGFLLAPLRPLPKYRFSFVGLDSPSKREAH